jgi:predicted RNA-binding Zn-ribbon protein involved in translation (DUF1610 family)
MMAQPPAGIPTKKFRCFACGNVIDVPQGAPKPSVCPRCGAPATMIHRIDKGPPGGMGAGRAGGGRGAGGPPRLHQS